MTHPTHKYNYKYDLFLRTFLFSYFSAFRLTISFVAIDTSTDSVVRAQLPRKRVAPSVFEAQSFKAKCSGRTPADRLKLGPIFLYQLPSRWTIPCTHKWFVNFTSRVRFLIDVGYLESDFYWFFIYEREINYLVLKTFLELHTST